MVASGKPAEDARPTPWTGIVPTMPIMQPVTAMLYKRGKKPATLLSPKAIQFSDVFNAIELPTPPDAFGHRALMKSEPWHMLRNDEYGNCVWAAKAHMHYLWSPIGGRPRVRITTRDTLSDYADQAGFRADLPHTDMAAAAEYHRKVGIRDAPTPGAGCRAMFTSHPETSGSWRWPPICSAPLR